MGRRALALGAAAALSVALVWTGVIAQTAPTQDAAQQIERGARIYARNCSPCHGTRMLDPQGAFDLRQFPVQERAFRFRDEGDYALCTY